jgi:hypothetical protein
LEFALGLFKERGKLVCTRQFDGGRFHALEELGKGQARNSRHSLDLVDTWLSPLAEVSPESGAYLCAFTPVLVAPRLACVIDRTDALKGVYQSGTDPGLSLLASHAGQIPHRPS